MYSENIRPWGRLVLGVTMVALLAACGTVQHTAKIEEGYVPPSEATIKLGEVKNKTGRVYDVDVEGMLTEALNDALKKEKLLASQTDLSALTLNVEIMEYAKGDAFKRWLWPGYGPTILEVHCDLLEGERVIGVADARRTVEAGGGYTVGAWEYVYGQVAEDVVKDVSAQLGR